MVYEVVYFSIDVVSQLWGLNSGSHVWQARPLPLIYIPGFLELTPKPRQALNFFYPASVSPQAKTTGLQHQLQPVPIHFLHTCSFCPQKYQSCWYVHGFCIHFTINILFSPKWSLRCPHPAMTLGTTYLLPGIFCCKSHILQLRSAPESGPQSTAADWNLLSLPLNSQRSLQSHMTCGRWNILIFRLPFRSKS